MEHRQTRHVGLLQHDADPADSHLQDGRLAVGGLFPTPIVTARLANADVLNAALRPAIEARRAVDPGVSISNLGGWHSADLLSWSGPAGHSVLDAARHLADRMTLLEDADELVHADIAWRITAWANLGTEGAANRSHAHPGAFWSGVYWVDDGGIAADPALGGLLEFSDPRGVLPSMVAPQLRIAVQDCLSAGRGEVLTPESGLMVLFPSWLMHAVTPYRGRRARISIALNLSLESDTPRGSKPVV